jgi:HD superfamily phosphodiesterase
VTVQIRADAPLERLLKQQAADHGEKFPNRGLNYYSRYAQIKQHLATKYYQATATGLAQGGHRFTKHDISHIDDVIHRAGQLLGLEKPSPQPFERLEPYETFVLLYAILLHDAGNAYERAGHEARAFDILRDMGGLCPLAEVEKRLVAAIAQAHGGKTDSDDKDTIPAMVRENESSIDGIAVHGRRLAALLRLADELSENSRRADEIALEKPSKSFLPNFYCKAINTKIDVLAGNISLTYAIKKEDLGMAHPDPENADHPTLVVDYIAKRIAKCDQERRYCNRFLNGFLYMDVMRASLEIFDGAKLIDEVTVDLSDRGYPSVPRPVVDIERRFDGVALQQKHLVPGPQVPGGAT